MTKFAKQVGSLNMVVGLLFALTYGGAIAIFSTMHFGEGNAGAFKAFLAVSLLFTGGLITTTFGLAVSVWGFCRPAEISRGFLQSPWFTLILSSPPLLLLFWQGTRYVFLQYI